MQDYWGKLTALLVISAPFAVIVYDYLMLMCIGYDATITAVIRQWATKYTELPYVCGGLFTWLWLHLFFEKLINK